MIPKGYNPFYIFLFSNIRMLSGQDGHRHARSHTMPILRGKNALTNPKLLQMMETGNDTSLASLPLNTLPFIHG